MHVVVHDVDSEKMSHREREVKSSMSVRRVFDVSTSPLDYNASILPHPNEISIEPFASVNHGNDVGAGAVCDILSRSSSHRKNFAFDLEESSVHATKQRAHRKFDHDFSIE